jgi:glycosyltransferase involved in cell wall biosynthesis
MVVVPSATIDARLPYLDPIAASAIRAIVRRLDLDLILVGRTRDLSTAIIGAGRRVAVVLYNQMQSGVDKHDWFHDRIYRRLDRAIVITEQGGRELAEHTLLAKEKIDLIPYAVDAARFAPDPARTAESRLRFDLPSDAFVIGMVGGFNPGKGQRELIRALGIAVKIEPKLAGSIFGLLVGYRNGDSAEYIGELDLLRAELPFAERVRFHPFLDDPSVAYRPLDIFVLASHSETFGIVLQEAMASGIAVIGTASGGVGEIVTNGETGLLVPPRDPEAIAEAIVGLYRDPERRARLAGNGRRSVIERYDPERLGRAFVESLLAAVRHRGAEARS